MTYINNSLNIIEQAFSILLEDVTLEEKKADLDRYYLNISNNLCNELKIAIIEYENTNKSNNFIITKNGWKFIPNNQKELPEIYLAKRKNNDELAEWIRKLNCIVLFILDDNNQIDNITKQCISTKLENALAHELTHYFTDSRALSSGRSVSIPTDPNNQKKYYNDKNEIEAYTKSLENFVFTNVKNNLPILHSGIVIEDQVNLLGTILNNTLNTCKTAKTNDFYKFLNNLTENNLKKVYKDIYQYVIDEYIKNFAFTDYNTNMKTLLTKKLYNSDLLNAWFKQNKF